MSQAPGSDAQAPRQAVEQAPGQELDDGYDLVVVGGGAAGLAGALTAARALRSVLVVDAGSPRNTPAHGVHNYLGREGTPPTELVAIGRAEVEAYGGRVVTGVASSAQRLDDADVPGAHRFRVHLEDGRSVLARRLLVATGARDELPDVPGLAERWGQDLHHCPFCHGREVSGDVLGILSTGPAGPHQALMWRGWSERVVLLQHTGPAPTPEQAEQMDARGIDVVEGEVRGLRVEDDRLTGVRLADGSVVAVQALVTTSRAVVGGARGGLLADLGLPAVDLGMGAAYGDHVPADPTGATTVPGLWLAGNVTQPMAPVLAAAAAGMTAGSMITKDLVDDDTAAAVQALRTAREQVPA